MNSLILSTDFYKSSASELKTCYLCDRLLTISGEANTLLQTSEN